MSRARRPLRVESLEDRLAPAAGTLDPSFGTGGSVVLTNSFFAADAAVDSLGRVVVVGASATGTTAPDFLVLRLNPDGTPDPTFGTNGLATVDFGGLDTPTGVSVDANNNVVVVGTRVLPGGGNDAMAFVRLTAASGAVDPTFGVGGTGRIVVPAPAGFSGLVAGRLVLDAAGRPVAAGSAEGPGGVAVVRLTADGSMLDPAFHGGAVDTLAQGPNSGQAVAVDAAGRIVVAGLAVPPAGNGPGPSQALVTRLLPDGSPDPAFNGGQPVVSLVFGGSSSVPNAVATDAAGNVYLTGAGAGLAGLPVARLTAAGSPDQAFGLNGVVMVGSQAGIGESIEVDPAGRVDLAGFTLSGTGQSDFLAARLVPSGMPDPLFNPAGPSPGPSPAPSPGVNVIDLGGNDQASALAFAPDGKIVIAGGSFHIPGTPSPTDTRTEVVRLAGSSNAPVGRPRDLSVGGASGATAGVFAPDASGRYVPPAARTTPAGLFPGFGGEVRTATGDFDGDGVEDTVLVTGPGARTVMAVVSGKDNSVLLAPQDPFGDANFTSGGFVTAGDIDRDGKAEWVVTPELKGGPRVIVFQLVSVTTATILANFFGIGDPAFRDGDRAALGDVNGDGVLDVFSIAAFNGGPRTALYDGKDVLVAMSQNRDPNKLTNDFFAAPSGTDEGRGGRSIAAGDVTDDGVADLIVTGDNLLGTGQTVYVFSGADLIAGRVPGFGANPVTFFFVEGEPGDALLSVATVNADGDNLADLVVGSGAGQMARVNEFSGKELVRLAGESLLFEMFPFDGTTADGVFVG